MSVDSAAAKGPSTTEGALSIPRDLANDILTAIPLLPNEWLLVFFSCVCLLASMARSVNCLGRKKAVQVHLIGAKPIVQVKR